jgi:hypothetical protein
MTTEDGVPQRLLDDQIAPFLQHLRDAGYAERTLRKKRTVVRAFVQGAKRKGLVMDDLNDIHAAAFITRSPRKRQVHVKFERAAMRLFFDYLHPEASLACQAQQEPISAAVGLLRRYQDYLRNDRGLAENSLHVYVPFIRDFLAAKPPRLAA